MPHGDLLINATGSGDTTLHISPGDRQFVRVLHYHVTSDRPVTVQFWSNPSSTGTLKDIVYSTNASGGGLATPEYNNGIFDCNVNESLVINLSNTANVGGALKYTLLGQKSQRN